MAAAVSIDVVRGRLEPAVADELVSFWSEQGALDETAARRRLGEVVCVLRDEGGRVAGVNSAFPGRVETIGGRRFWIYRSFLRGDAADAWPDMVDAAFRALNEEFRATGEGPPGLCVPVGERREILRRPEAVWPGTSFLFAGYAPEGFQLRVAYFDGALIGPGENGVMGDHTLEHGYRIEPFTEQDEVTGQDVIDLWTRERVVPPQEASRRVSELLLVAIHEEDGLVGVASAYPERDRQTDMQLWCYRTFVVSTHRKGNVAVQLALVGRDLLQERFVSGADTRGAGVLYEVENVGLKRYFNQALWLPTLLTFIGENAAGDHVYVRYFPGARTPAPPEAATWR